MPHGVAEVAKQLGVSKSTVIRWSSVFSAHLSDLASPEPGQPRQFTEADLATLRRAQRRLGQPGATFESVSERLAVIEPEEPEEAEEHEAPTAGPEEAEHERAESSTASQALMVLDQQMRIIDAQAGQLADQRAQLTDQAARLREQASQAASQAAELAALRERLARVEEAQRQQERRRFRWPWEPRPEE